MAELREAYMAIRPVTRAWLTASTVVLFAIALHLPLRLDLLMLKWPLVVSRFHVWRLVTNFVVLGGPSFNTLIRCVRLPA